MEAPAMFHPMLAQRQALQHCMEASAMFDRHPAPIIVSGVPGQQVVASRPLVHAYHTPGSWLALVGIRLTVMVIAGFPESKPSVTWNWYQSVSAALCSEKTLQVMEVFGASVNVASMWPVDKLSFRSPASGMQVHAPMLQV